MLVFATKQILFPKDQNNISSPQHAILGYTSQDPGKKRQKLVAHFSQRAEETIWRIYGQIWCTIDFMYEKWKKPSFARRKNQKSSFKQSILELV